MSSLLTEDLRKNRKLTYGESFYENISSKKRPRLVKKCGELNVQMRNVANHKLRLFKDIFNTIIGNWLLKLFLHLKKKNSFAILKNY